MARYKNWARFALAAVLWTIAWTCMTVALTKDGEPWPWGGLGIFIGIMAMTASAYWIAECVACREVRLLCKEVQALRQDREAMPGMLAEAVGRAFAMRRVGG